MPKVLIVTNDFPPRRGGIQSFVHALASTAARGRRRRVRAGLARARRRSTRSSRSRCPAPGSLMLPVPPVSRRAAARCWPSTAATPSCSAQRRRSACSPRRCAPRAPAGSSASRTATRRAGRRCPGPAALLAGSASDTDALTYLGEYTRVRLAPGARPRRPRSAWCGSRPGWTPRCSGPAPGETAVRARLRPGRPAGGRVRLPAGPAQGTGHADPRLAPGPGRARRGGCQARSC